MTNDFKYGNANSRAAGSISITNCDFAGKQSSATSDNIPKRGWIFFDGRFQGPAVNISGCNFVGDVLGSNTGGTYPDVVTTKSGQCIVNNADISLNINNCNFNSYAQSGVRTSAGHTYVRGCHFESMWVAITLEDSLSYSGVGRGQFDSTANLFVEGCSFKGYGDSNGIEIGDLSSNSSNKDNTCIVKKLRIRISNKCNILALSCPLQHYTPGMPLSHSYNMSA